MDIREVRKELNPLDEPKDTDSKPPSICPECAATVHDGDRFCQECGARITVNRIKKLGRDKVNEARYPASSTANSTISKTSTASAKILCINCGAGNSPVSLDCSACKKALVPEPANGKTFLRDYLAQGKPKRRRFGQNLGDKLPVLESHGSGNYIGIKQQPGSRTADDGSLSSAAVASSSSDSAASETRTVAPATTATKQRIPRSFTPTKISKTEEDLAFLFSRTGEADDWQENKVDRIVAEKIAVEKSTVLDHSFGNLMVESHSGGFSLSAFLVRIESIFERIPVPIVLFVVGMIVIFTTIHLTTIWHSQEIRLTALDKLASHAEDDMKAYKLDDAVLAMSELEKTERGDLPPRARSVLNQSLWLRAYAYATRSRYDLAAEDMKRVTSAFNSYEDATEKLEQYKEAIKQHPEYAKNTSRPPIGPPGTDAGSTRATTEPADAKSSTEIEKEPIHVPTPKSERPTPTPIPQSTVNAVAAVEEKIPTVKENQPPSQSPKTARESKSPSLVPVPNGRPAKGNKNMADLPDSKESKMNSGSLPDNDSKRYSNLLIKYFSETHDSEPPSFEEWQSGGKKDF